MKENQVKAKKKKTERLFLVKEKKDDGVAQIIPIKEETCKEGDRTQKKPLITKNERNTQTTEK